MDQKKLPYPLKISITMNSEVIFEKTFTEYPVVIGRSSKCNVPLSQFDFLSREHCSVVVTNGVLEVIDLNSSNGIFFEGERVKKAPIKGYAQIEIGEILITMELDRSEAVTTIQKMQEEVTAKKNPKLPPACPVVDAAKTHQRNIEEELGKKLSLQKKPPRIPFEPSPTTAEDVLPQMIHFGGEHRPLDVKLDNNLATKEQEPSISVVEQNPVHKVVPAEKFLESPKKLISRHPQAAQLKPQQRVLESYVTWKDQIYNLNQFYAGDKVILGSGPEANVVVPVMTVNFKLAQFDGMNTHIFIPQNLKFELEGEIQKHSYDQAPFSPSVSKKNNYYTLKLGASELLTVQISSDIFVHLRYAPAPREFSQKISFVKGNALKVSGMIVGAIGIMLFALILSTKEYQSPPQNVNSSRTVAGALVGGLSHSQVVDSLRAFMPQIQQCYKNTAGNVQYELGITSKGFIQSANLKKSNIPNANVFSPCVMSILKRVNFPVASNGQNTLTNIDFSVSRL